MSGLEFVIFRKKASLWVCLMHGNLAIPTGWKENLTMPTTKTVLFTVSGKEDGMMEIVKEKYTMYVKNKKNKKMCKWITSVSFI